MTKAPIIDFHTHYLVRDVMEQCLPHAVASNRGHHQLPPHLLALFEKMMTPEGIIEGIDRLGVDMAVISSPAVLLPLHWAEPALALKLAQKLNDMAAAWSQAHSRHIIGSFVLPLQDIGLTLKELRRATGQLGLTIANIPA